MGARYCHLNVLDCADEVSLFITCCSKYKIKAVLFFNLSWFCSGLPQKPIKPLSRQPFASFSFIGHHDTHQICYQQN